MGASIFDELNQAIGALPEPPPPTTIVIHSPGASVGKVYPEPPPPAVNVTPASLANLTSDPSGNKPELEFPEIPADFCAPTSTAAIATGAPSNADRSERLEHLLDLSLAKAEELLSVELVPGADEFTKIASMQKDLVVSVLGLGVKVDENRFKKRQGDALTGILANLLTREKALGQLVDLTPDGKPN